VANAGIGNPQFRIRPQLAQHHDGDLRDIG